MKNVVLRSAKHEDPNNQSKPAKDLKSFSDYPLEWSSEYTRKRTILELFLNESLNSSRNEQLDTELLVLFKNGVTWS